MELHTRDVTALHDRRERLAVFGDGGRLAGDRRHIAVGEVHLRALRHAFEDRCFAALDVETVPPDVRHLHNWITVRPKADTIATVGVAVGFGSVRLSPDRRPEAITPAR